MIAKLQRVVSKIDAQGYFVSDVLLEDGEATPQGCIESRPPEGFYSPKWAGSEWIEGRPQAEILDDAKAQKVGEFADRAITDLSVLFTEGKGRDETMLLLAGHVLQICEALNVSADPRLSQVVATGEKALTKKAEVEGAATVEELEAVEWEEPI
jgi:hypothetical protein